MARRVIDPQKVYGHLKDRVNWAICDKCGWHWPEDILRERSRSGGRRAWKICPNHKSYAETTDEKTVRVEKAAARLVKKKEPIPKWPHPPEMRAVSGIYKLTPPTLQLTRGGANGTIVLDGRNLSAADSFTFSSLSVISAATTTYSPIDPETRGNAATLTVRAPVGATVGFHDLLVNGDTFRMIFEVRP